MPGFQSIFSFSLHDSVLAKLATSSIRVKIKIKPCPLDQSLLSASLENLDIIKQYTVKEIMLRQP